MSRFHFTYWRAPLDPAAPFYRRQKYGPWETAAAEGSEWRVVMNGLDAETFAGFVEVPGPAYDYLARHEGHRSTHWRVVHDWHPGQPPVPHETIWMNGEWKEGPLPSENEMLSRHRVPPPCFPGPHWFTGAQQRLWDEGPPIKPSGDQTQAQAENLAVVTFQRVCELEDCHPLPDERLIRAAIKLQHEIAREFDEVARHPQSPWNLVRLIHPRGGCDLASCV